MLNFVSKELSEANEPLMSDALSEIRARASAAGFQVETQLIDASGSLPAEYYLKIYLPNGTDKRLVVINESHADQILHTPLEPITFLGDYSAFLNTQDGSMEALLINDMPGLSPWRTPRLWGLPGVEIFEEFIEATDDLEPEEVPRWRGQPESWRLRVCSGAIELEASPPSPLAKILLRPSPQVTLKIRGAVSSTNREAVEILERLGNAFLFDLDVVTGATAQLAKIRKRPMRSARRRIEPREPQFPKNSYAPQALGLYQYGRTASGLPLLEYLAYYQSIEFFFPYFAREQTHHEVRAKLLNPGFNPSDDGDISRLIELSSTRTVLAERDQMRATVRASITEPDLRSILESTEYKDHFGSNKQKIRGVSPIRFNDTQSDLRDQVADRIYAIRCRIVHSKQDGGEIGEDALLPSSEEAHFLQPEISLLRTLSQNTLIARAARS